MSFREDICRLCGDTGCGKDYCRNNWLQCKHCDRSAHEDEFAIYIADDVCDNCESNYCKCFYCKKYYWAGYSSREEVWCSLRQKWYYKDIKTVCKDCKKIEEDFEENSY